MKTLDISGTFLEDFKETWQNSNVGLPSVIRWSDSLDSPFNTGMRHQNTLQHKDFFEKFAGTMSLIVEHNLSKQNDHLDLLLLEYAFKFHDDGEGLLRRDIPAPLKKPKDDVDEYLAFMESIKLLPDFVRDKYEEAFLLQFSLNNNEVIVSNLLFPKKAYGIMNKLYKQKYRECLLFFILEKLEYLFYPVEMEEKHPFLLTWVIRSVLRPYQIINGELPGLREQIFTEDFEVKMLSYLESHKNVPERENYVKK